MSCFFRKKRQRIQRLVRANCRHHHLTQLLFNFLLVVQQDDLPPLEGTRTHSKGTKVGETPGGPAGNVCSTEEDVAAVVMGETPRRCMRPLLGVTQIGELTRKWMRTLGDAKPSLLVTA